jgi:ribosomal protein S19E (S16A)
MQELELACVMHPGIQVHSGWDAGLARLVSQLYVRDSDPAGVVQPETHFGCEHQQTLEPVHAVEGGGSPSRKLKLVQLETMLMAVEL